MAGELLLDTGPLVALLDRSQSAHERCREFFAVWKGPVVTTEAVLTEATHLLSAVHQGADTCLRFMLQGGAILSSGGLARLERSARLMQKYHDVPMDYADATLVSLAEELGTNRVFTLDVSGFSVYRWDRRRTFQIVPV